MYKRLLTTLWLLPLLGPQLMTLADAPAAYAAQTSTITTPTSTGVKATYSDTLARPDGLHLSEVAANEVVPEPGDPRIIALSTTSLKVTWTGVNDPNFQYLVVLVSGTTRTTKTIPGTQEAATFAGLTPGVSYMAGITAEDKATSAESTTAVTQMLKLPTSVPSPSPTSAPTTVAPSSTPTPSATKSATPSPTPTPTTTSSAAPSPSVPTPTPSPSHTTVAAASQEMPVGKVSAFVIAFLLTMGVLAYLRHIIARNRT